MASSTKPLTEPMLTLHPWATTVYKEYNYARIAQDITEYVKCVKKKNTFKIRAPFPRGQMG